ncbi:MAG: hypothetical protein Unbinned4512contig1001_9 [Prokaryotic dsDNA virus sp.]|nr:MAG: hypothetical protein Unbinned4512contig1001_9 [Prokaryotic dsDNA virus sp.]|tara:strand:+ start:1180 stop:1377 length:198 start_codon:yes stop_codon:yes gene_type:complete
MLVRVMNQLTGKLNTMTLNVTPEQLERWRQGALIQEVMPQLSIDEREFLKTGVTPDEWKTYFDEQ